MDANEKERLLVATLLCDLPSQLPEPLSRVLCHAPESFADNRLGVIATAIREMALANKPVAPLTVRGELVDTGKMDDAGGALFVDALAADAVTVPIANFEAQSVWQSYVERQTEATLDDALAALRARPTSAAVIAKGVVQSLERVSKNGSGGPKTLSVRQPDELLAMEFDDKDQLLGDRLLEKGGSLVIAGAGGIGKSRLLLQLIIASITGREFVTLTTRGEDLRWLVLQGENSNRRLKFDIKNFSDWAGNKWAGVNGQLFIHTIENDADGFLALDDPQNFSRLADTVASVNPDVIAFDNLTNFAVGDLNKDQDMRATCEAISRLTKKGGPNRACIVLHHALTGRAGASKAVGFDRSSFGRNSKALLAWTRGQINLSPGYPDNNDTLVASCGKCSNGREFAPFAVTLNAKTMIYEPDPGFDLTAWQADMSGRKSDTSSVPVELVVELCKGAMSKRDLAKAIMDDSGCVKQYAYRKIKQAEVAKKIHFNRATEMYVSK